MKITSIYTFALNISVVALMASLSAHACDEGTSDEEYVDEFFVSTARPIAWPDAAYLNLLATSLNTPHSYSDSDYLTDLANAVARVNAKGEALRYTQRQYERDLVRIFKAPQEG